MPRGIPNNPTGNKFHNDLIGVLESIGGHLDDIASKIPDDSRELAGELAELTAAVGNYRTKLLALVGQPTRQGTHKDGLMEAVRLMNELL